MNIVKEWLLKAQHDLLTAKRLMEGNAPILDTSIYHTQQCAEKALKGYLAYKERHIERTHNLRLLIEQCIELNNNFKNYIDDARILNPYAFVFRYPGDSMEPDIEEVWEAIESAEKIYRFVEKIVESG